MAVYDECLVQAISSVYAIHLCLSFNINQYSGSIQYLILGIEASSIKQLPKQPHLNNFFANNSLILHLKQGNRLNHEKHITG